ncbi:ParB/RepB/Spo0J family partition protein [Chondrinema litorale]|uniref:ParB/RepB/Spo0J family partition protein n=1 Tax=Chondrinema litorale TaxID=2994555 RepID=UPI002543E064|nr:ParB/RepB/Spo0J family partition protein [Chondrinema litorale]UZR94743.1 ParB/RepB/Spo0J family partition protein [Chondrinema litorale]
MSDQKKTTLKKRSGTGERKSLSLGKGLGSLLSDAPKKEDNTPKSPADIYRVPVDQIETNPFQPRQDFDEEALKELADSIETHGIIQPITLRKLSEKEYQIISGERRWQASKIAGLVEIPAYVRTANDQQMHEMALIENIQRENLNPIEIANSYQRLISEFNLKQEELGDRVGKKRATVTNYLRLLRLSDDVKAALRDGKISMGHAKELINIENIDQQIFVLNKIIEEGLSVRKVEALARELKKGKEVKPVAEKKPASEFEQEIKLLQSKLSSQFSTKINIQTKGKDKGEIKIPFHSVDDLNRILELLGI